MENPIKIDDLGVPLFSETSIYTKLILKQTDTKHSRLREQWKRKNLQNCPQLTHTIHGTGIFTYIYHKKINQM